MVAFTRLPVLVVGILAVVLVGTIPPPAAEALWRVSPSEIPNMLARWDTEYYHSIATTGYHWDPSVFRHQNVVFFPLYPALMRGLGALLGGHPLAAGLIVSLLAFTGAVVVLHKLAVLEIGPDHAWPAVLLLAAFPYALFFSAVYTESLFLLLSVGAFLAMRTGRLSVAAVCGLLAGITRPNGFWLALPLALMAWTSDRRVRSLLVSCAPIVGLLIFCAYLEVRVGDPIAWLHGQAAWGAPLLGRPPAPDPLPLPGEPDIKWVDIITWIGNIAAFGAAVAAIGPISRRLGVAYGAWIVVNIFPPVAAHLFMSLGRFVAVLFPVFFWLALRVPRSQVPRVVMGFGAAQAVLAMWFFLWQPVI